MKRAHIISFVGTVFSAVCLYSVVGQAKIDNFNSLIQQQAEQEKQTYDSIAQKDSKKEESNSAEVKSQKKLLVIKRSQKQFVVSEDSPASTQSAVTSAKKSRSPASDSAAIYQKIGEELNDSN